jgi:multiple sugar transport system permease protein
MMRVRLRKITRHVFIYIAVLLILIWALFPIYWIVVSSVSTRTELYSRPYKHWIPASPTLQNFTEVLSSGQKYRAGSYLPTSKLLTAGLRNSILIAVLTAVVVTMLATMAGYVFARLKFGGKDLAFFSIMLIMPLPIWVSLISLYFLLAQVKLTDTNLGLVLVSSTFAIPLAMWLMATFIRDIPVAIEEAALIDGASRWGVLTRIVFPLALPGLTSVFLMTFLNTWNAFLIPLVLTNTPRSQTITVVLSLFVGQYEVAWEHMAAATVLGIIPPLLLAFFFQRYLVRGLSMGAIKE